MANSPNTLALENHGTEDCGGYSPGLQQSQAVLKVTQHTHSWGCSQMPVFASADAILI